MTLPSFDSRDELAAVIAAFDLLCAARGWGRGQGLGHLAHALRGQYDPDDFDADELGLDPEDDFDA